MKWFGESWGAPVCSTGEHVETPVGIACEHCSYLIEEGEQGLVLTYYSTLTRDFPVHLGCLFEMVGAK